MLNKNRKIIAMSSKGKETPIKLRRNIWPMKKEKKVKIKIAVCINAIVSLYLEKHENSYR